jgi:hypothetical protein
VSCEIASDPHFKIGCGFLQLRGSSFSSRSRHARCPINRSFEPRVSVGTIWETSGGGPNMGCNLAQCRFPHSLVETIQFLTHVVPVGAELGREAKAYRLVDTESRSAILDLLAGRGIRSGDSCTCVGAATSIGQGSRQLIDCSRGDVTWPCVTQLQRDMSDRGLELRPCAQGAFFTLTTKAKAFPGLCAAFLEFVRPGPSFGKEFGREVYEEAREKVSELAVRSVLDEALTASLLLQSAIGISCKLNHPKHTPV